MTALSRSRSDVFVLFGSRISRDTAIYVAGTAAVLPFSLVTVAVLTRFLDPSEYGDLAVMFVFASLLTVVYNLGSLQGTLMWVFGSSGEDVDAGGAQTGAGAGTKRRALTTGFILTCAIAGLATVPLFVFADPVGRLLLGEPDQVAAVRWAAGSAALGAVWRLVVNVLRMERRPVAFAWLNTLRPAFVLACSVPLVAAGFGVAGALAGTAIGTALGLVACLAAGRRSYAAAFDAGDAWRIVRSGSRLVLVIVGLWVVHNADVFLLSRYAPADEVGLFRLAGRVAVFISYFVSAFLMAWAPLERTSLFRGTYASLGRPEVRSKMITYFVVTALTLVLAMAVTADVLVRIAASSYAGAAPLIAPVGLGFVLYGLFVVLIRSAQVRRRMLLYGGMAMACAVLFALIGMVLIPAYGGYGAALSVIASMTIGCGLIVLATRRSSEPVPFEWARLAGAVALALAGYAVVRWLAPLTGGWQPAIELLTFVAFLVLLVALRIVPPAHVRPLARIAWSLGPSGAARRRLVSRLTDLPEEQRSTLEALTRYRVSPDGVAASLGIPREAVCERLVRTMRALDDRERSTDADAAVGAYLLSGEPPAERDGVARRLWEEGVDPLELHELESTYDRLRSLHRDDWPLKEETGWYSASGHGVEHQR
ncbi:MAG: lipopolysaccharide biosynthesis protein [Solirubrobacteraceae bacterium]